MPLDLITSFAKKTGKSAKEIEDIYNKIKDSLKDQGKGEEDENFYALLVGSLKKALKLEGSVNDLGVIPDKPLTKKKSAKEIIELMDAYLHG